jgi:hypothetical protein
VGTHDNSNDVPTVANTTVEVRRDFMEPVPQTAMSCNHGAANTVELTVLFSITYTITRCGGHPKFANGQNLISLSGS